MVVALSRKQISLDLPELKLTGGDFPTFPQGVWYLPLLLKPSILFVDFSLRCVKRETCKKAEYSGDVLVGGKLIMSCFAVWWRKGGGKGQHSWNSGHPEHIRNNFLWLVYLILLIFFLPHSRCVSIHWVRKRTLPVMEYMESTVIDLIQKEIVVKGNRILKVFEICCCLCLDFFSWFSLFACYIFSCAHKFISSVNIQLFFSFVVIQGKPFWPNVFGTLRLNSY